MLNSDVGVGETPQKRKEPAPFSLQKARRGSKGDAHCNENICRRSNNAAIFEA